MSQDDKEMSEQVRRMQKRMDRLFSNMMPTIGLVAVRQQRKWRPATDVYETEDCVIVRVEVAGMSEQDFTVSLANRRLSISGVRRDTECKLAYQQLEISYGHFFTEVFLPHNVERDEIRAVYENGFLTVTLPKVQTHHVQITEKTVPQEGTE
jgi:HSP20 family molecular chaperone IbpA